jgi:hypothetical protein
LEHLAEAAPNPCAELVKTMWPVVEATFSVFGGTLFSFFFPFLLL